VDDRDTVIFVTIPALLILKRLDGDDKDICRSFFPPMFGEGGEDMPASEKEAAKGRFVKLQSDYEKYKAKCKNAYDYYNLIEETVLGMESQEGETARISDLQLSCSGISRAELLEIVQQVRILSMQLARHKPTEWNAFLDVALDQGE